jgi:cell division protein FtsZ
VSVVATGIEADSVVQPQPAKVFTFPSRAAPAPASAPAMEESPTDGADVSDEDDTLDLTEEVTSDDEGGEELVLDSDDVLTAPVGAPPIAPPSDEDETPVEGDGDQAEQPKAASGTGGTLFERMSSIARGAPRAQIDEGESDGGFSQPLDIPRFLNRQNNQ